LLNISEDPVVVSGGRPLKPQYIWWVTWISVSTKGISSVLTYCKSNVFRGKLFLSTIVLRDSERTRRYCRWSMLHVLDRAV
jgi:hypothetical protein